MRPIPSCRVMVRQRTGFTLVELLVVMGIISILISLLLPSVNKAKMQVQSLACKANVRSCGQMMLAYSMDNKGQMFPYGLGSSVPVKQRWPMYVFKPAVPNPKVMICPVDQELGAKDTGLLDKHSYILNNHLEYDGIRYTRTHKINASDIVVMGEKKTEKVDYYMNGQASDNYSTLVETQRHGRFLYSNLLYLDMHVSNDLPSQWVDGKGKYTMEDPWDVLPGRTGGL